MKDFRTRNNPGLKDGTRQNDRLLAALVPESTPIDERTIEDFWTFAQKYAQRIQYYNTEDQPNGDWKEFFSDSLPKHAPHRDLWTAFLELMKHAQAHLNTLTRRHLDFYYHDVLRFTENPAIPDQVHVLFELAKNVELRLIPAGTLLDAGKDDTGTPLVYQIDKDLVVNTAKIESLKTVFVEKEAEEIQSIHAAPVANSADGQGAELKEEEPKWNTFGESQKGKSEEERTMIDVEIGFALASPVLLLKEGTRTITVTFGLEQAIEPQLQTNLSEAFQVYLSGEQEWIGPFWVDGRVPRSDLQTLQLTLELTPDQPPVVPYRPEALVGSFSTAFPLIKILLNTRQKPNLYNQLKDFKVTHAAIDARVKEIRDLIVGNDAASLDLSNPFQPFGPLPAIGSSFYIGNAEVFQKRLEHLEINVTWHQIPESNLGVYYAGYHQDEEVKENPLFKAKLALLYKKAWFEKSEAVPLFDATDASRPHTIAIREFGEEFFDGQENRYQRNVHLQKLERYNHLTQDGFIRLELVEPATPFQAFGHKQYPQLYSEALLAKTQKTETGPEEPSETPLELPNEPYTPEIKSLSLNYAAREEFFFIQKTDQERLERFFHIEPFGVVEIYRHGQRKEISLVPQYRAEGHLYIGITDLNPPQHLFLLFQMAEGSADPDVTVRAEDIQWSYLVHNQWTPFHKLQILSDATQGLQTSGILSFDIPGHATDDNTLLPAGLHWLRATIDQNTSGINKLIHIHPQAATASCVLSDLSSDHLNQSLPKDSIKGLTVKDPAIKSVSQPYASFGGKIKEQSPAFYIRVSERLRHKKRGITLWDNERLVLEHFPSIYKVKCLTPAHSPSELPPGEVTVVVIPDLKNKNAVNPLSPKVSQTTLLTIKEYLGQFLSPFVRLEVKNPIYEQLAADFEVGFHRGYDAGYYGQQLEEELKRFLSPWAFEEGEDINFGGKIHKSVLLTFVEHRPYVDFVSNFKLHHRSPLGEIDLPQEDTIQSEKELSTFKLLFPSPQKPEIWLHLKVDFRPQENEKKQVDYNALLLEELRSLFAAKPAIHLSFLAELLHFVETKAYVRSVPKLNLYHIPLGFEYKSDVEMAKAQHSRSILVSAERHTINVLKAGHERFETPEVFEGINYMSIGETSTSKFENIFEVQ